MNRHCKNGIIVILFWLSLTTLFSCAGSSETEDIYYSLEMDGRTFGYQKLGISSIEEDGVSLTLLKEESRSLSSALGANIDTSTEAEYRFDFETGRLVSCDIRIDQGNLKIRLSARIEGDTAHIFLAPGGGEKEVVLGPDVVFENPVFFRHVERDFLGQGIKTKRYKILDLLDREVHEVSYTYIGQDDVQCAGQTYQAAVFDQINHEIGLKLRLWINPENGYLLKAIGPRSTSQLADRSTTRGLKRADLDNHIFARTGTQIAEVLGISYLKVRAVLEPIGNWITPESLNVRGQSFEGTVENNRIEGIFEVNHEKYDGRNAPPFPPDYGDQPHLESFLKPEDFIESDDLVLIQKARELTVGASDSWEAAKRLSSWVADNIGYDVPGGASARNTYDTREGECGAHSRLFAAFCRAVGIPARVVWGCMYVPDHGGSFGQHGWNEVYMGEDAGWIPLDTTAREIDYADSGHVRLGVLSSAHIAWNPKQMEILDFTAGSQKFGEIREIDDPAKYQPFLGEYRGPRGGIFTVAVQNGRLSVDIPGRTTFELRDPDEEGRWFFALSRDVSIIFPTDEAGRVASLVLTNKVRIPRKETPPKIDADIPEEFRSYLGQYPIPMEAKEISVLYRRGNLAIDFPGGGIRELQGPDADGIWFERSEGDKYSFVVDDSGGVKFMILEETVHCRRIR